MHRIGLFVLLGLGLSLNSQLVAMKPCNDSAGGLKQLIEVIIRINDDHKKEVTSTALTLVDSDSSLLQIALPPLYENDKEYSKLLLKLPKALSREITEIVCSARKNYILAAIHTVSDTLENQENFYRAIYNGLKNINLSMLKPIQDDNLSAFSFEEETYRRELDQQT